MTTQTVEHPQTYIGRGNAPFMRIAVVMDLTGLGRSTIYRLMAEELFPSPVRLTKRLVVWRRADIERWFDSRPRATH